MTPDVEYRIQVLSEKPRLDIDNIDFTVKNPEVLRQRLTRPFQYFQRVEMEVAAMDIHTLLPNSPDGYVDRFVENGWTPDETLHGEAFERLNETLGIEKPVVVQEHSPFQYRLAGTVGRMWGQGHEIFELVYHGIGAMHEKLTSIGYQRLEAILLELGETGLASTMIRPIMRDEAGHLGYYRLVVGKLMDSMKPWQISAARLIVRRGYDPVGAQNDAQRAAFGEIAVILAGDARTELAQPIQRLAGKLLQFPVDSHFVIDAIESCVSKAQELSAAA